jgi:hypothetical protein
VAVLLARGCLRVLHGARVVMVVVVVVVKTTVRVSGCFVAERLLGAVTRHVCACL